MDTSPRPFRTPADRLRGLTRRGRVIAALCLAALIPLGVLYARLFTWPGISFQGEYLKQTAAWVYTGRVDGHDVTISFSAPPGLYGLRYQIGDRPPLEYQLSLAPMEGTGRSAVTVTVNDTLRFEGQVSNVSGGTAIFFDTAGEPYLAEQVGFVGLDNTGGLDDPGWQPSLASLYRTATGHAGRIRGSGEMLAAAIALLAIFLLEACLGNALFHLGASFTVKADARTEPSEWYRLQRGCAIYLFPVLGVLCLILALFV